MGDGQDRTEESTSKHRAEGRRQGKVAKSTDLIHAASLIALLLVLPFAGAAMAAGVISSMRMSMSTIPRDVSSAHLLAYSTNALKPALPGLFWLIFTVLLVSLSMGFAQVGFVISAESMKPSFSKLNPMNGIQRYMSPGPFFDAAKALGKLGFFGFIAYSAIRGSWERIITLDMLPPVLAVTVVMGVLKTLTFRIALGWGSLAGFDYYFQRKQTDKSLKMTKVEVKQEMKDSEMSPLVKMARAKRRRQLMRRRLKEAVRTADVVVTNPTHYAVALKYEPGKNHAPVVVAKGVDFLAAKIREEAQIGRVPLVPNPALARALYAKCEIGDHVPRELFQAVAEVLAHVYRTLKKIPR